MVGIFGILSGLVVFTAAIPYLHDTIKGKTKPQRVSWAIFCTIHTMNFMNQQASGAASSLWLIGGLVAATGLIFLVSIKKGVGGFNKFDLICISGAALGIALWIGLDSPIASLVCNMVVTTIAILPTYKKAYKKPNTETKLTWFLGSTGELLAAISVGSFNPVLLALPLQSFVLQGGLFVLLYIRSKK